MKRNGKKRKEEEVRKKKVLEEEETESNDRWNRLKKAASKRKILLEKLEKEKKSKIIEKKDKIWIKKKQDIWRKYGLGRKKFEFENRECKKNSQKMKIFPENTSENTPKIDHFSKNLDSLKKTLEIPGKIPNTENPKIKSQEVAKIPKIPKKTPEKIPDLSEKSPDLNENTPARKLPILPARKILKSPKLKFRPKVTKSPKSTKYPKSPKSPKSQKSAKLKIGRFKEITEVPILPVLKPLNVKMVNCDKKVQKSPVNIPFEVAEVIENPQKIPNVPISEDPTKDPSTLKEFQNTPLVKVPEDPFKLKELRNTPIVKVPEDPLKKNPGAKLPLLHTHTHTHTQTRIITQWLHLLMPIHEIEYHLFLFLGPMASLKLRQVLR